MRKKSFILKFFFVLSASLFASFSFAQLKTFEFKELDSLQRTSKKPVAIFIHTDWCRYCGAMKNVTFKKDDVVQLLNEKFYLVSFNAEQKESIRFKGRQFEYQPTGVNTGINQLAIELGLVKGQLSYPTLCFLNSDYKIIYQHAGYIAADKLVAVLQKLSH